jgi:hypothetical protein
LPTLTLIKVGRMRGGSPQYLLLSPKESYHKTNLF